jgi:hypothetical protein
MMTKERMKWCLEAVTSLNGPGEAEALREYVSNLEDIKITAEDLQLVTDDEHQSKDELKSAKENLQTALDKLKK